MGPYGAGWSTGAAADRFSLAIRCNMLAHNTLHIAAQPICNSTYQLLPSHVYNAGHETTAATLGFTLYYIATNPEVEARVLREIDSVLGSRFEPNVDDIPKLVGGDVAESRHAAVPAMHANTPRPQPVTETACNGPDVEVACR